MIGRTNVGGGGSGNAFAYIGVTYPAGATLTCTDGKRTLRAKDTTGLYVFPVPYAGTWTVTATDGTQTDSRNVTVSTLWEVKTVNLSFSTRIIIYNAGDSGWSQDTVGMLPSGATVGGTATFGEYGIEINVPYTTPSTYCVIRTNNKIDLTGTKKLIVYGGSWSYYTTTGLAVYVGDYISGSTKATYVGDTSVRSNQTTITFDSVQSGSHYLFVVAWARTGTVGGLGIETMELTS